MIIINSHINCPSSAKNSVVALGNFDGVHIGHKAIIEKTLEIAKSKGIPSAVMSFEPHPVSFFKPDIKPFRITPLPRKQEILENMGVDILFALDFNLEFSNLSAADFVENILVSGLAVKHVVIGYDFIFGHKRSGNADFLKKSSEKHGFGFTQLEAIKNDGKIYSSTRIREFIRTGEIESAEELLGHSFIISGKVADGEKRGGKIGFHTANIPLGEYIRPAFGVYAARVKIEDEKNWRNAVINIGVKPTFGAKQETLEAHIFDFNSDIYGKTLAIKLIRYIRPEMKFNSMEELSMQIKKDSEKAKEILTITPSPSLTLISLKAR